MNTTQEPLYCETCGKTTVHLIQHPSHLLHLFLTIVTAGLWLLVWVFQRKSAPRCGVCGTTARYRPFLGYKKTA